MANFPKPALTISQVEQIVKLYSRYLREKISFLFVTYNRCPYKNFEKNPLTWAFQSLMSSSWSKIDEYFVVIDGSTDYTEENLKWLRSKYYINLNILKRKNRKGCSFSRKEGIEHLNNNTFFMGDDDCLYKKDFILGGLIGFNYLRERYRKKLAVMSLPVFEMDIEFRNDEKLMFIGKTYFERAWFYHNFDKFPKEYRKKGDIYIDKYELLYKPFETETFKGVTINDRNALIEAGNFADLSAWENDYSEHIEVSYKLRQKGYKMFHLPDAKISCTHIKYGSPVEKLNDVVKNVAFDGAPYTLGEINDLSKLAPTVTGCRVQGKVFLNTKIGSFLSFYLKVNIDYAMVFAIMEYENFVDRNKNFETDPVLNNLTRPERLDIWRNAVKKGVKITEAQTGKNYDNFYSLLMKTLHK